MDRDQFAPLVNELYTLHGWDAENGWPTKETLQNLGLGAIHEPMISGAKKAKEKQGPKTAKREKEEVKKEVNEKWL